MRCQDAVVGNKGSDLPATLLGAVQEALRSDGASALSLRDVARRAGVSHAAPAHHFGSKTGLLTAFAVQSYQAMAQAVLDEISASNPADGPSALAAIGRGYVRFAIEEPTRFDVMFRVDSLDESDPDLVAAMNAAFSVLVDTVERCGREGFVGDRDPMLVAVAAWSIAHGLASLWISGRLVGRIDQSSSEALAADVSELFVDAVLGRR
jgi:AcrR family transcriptional regulator